MMHLATIALPVVLIVILGVLVGFRAFRAVQAKERPLPVPVQPAPQQPAPQQPQGMTWQPQPVDQGCLELFDGGALWPVHHGDGIANPTVTRVATTWHRGYPITAFTYGYTETGTAHQYTVVFVRLPAAVPALQLQPAAAAPPSAPFDTAFTVQAQDPNAAARLLTPAVTGWLAADPRARQFPLYLEGTVASTWRRDSGPVPEFVNPAADLLAEFLDRTR